MKRDLDPRKPGKGRPDINSSIFLLDLATFVASAKAHRPRSPTFYLNQANKLFMQAELRGMKLLDDDVAQGKWLLASWYVMLAMESQTSFPRLVGWSQRRRTKLLNKLHRRLAAVAFQLQDADEIRMDLLPRVALVRLSINQELSIAHIGLTAASEWKHHGLRSVAARMGSAKRHFDAAHWGQKDEDHLAHLLWNMMAIYHTCVRFPARNDCRRMPVHADVGRSLFRVAIQSPEPPCAALHSDQVDDITRASRTGRPRLI